MITVEGIKAKDCEDEFVLLNGKPAYIQEVYQGDDIDAGKVLLVASINERYEIEKEKGERALVSRIDTPRHLDIYKTLPFIKKNYERES